MAIGIIQMAQARAPAGVIGGGIWIFVGSVMLGNRLGLLQVNIWGLWPLVLVLLGEARTSANPSAPRLVVRGFVMMGSVDIKN